MKTNKIYNEDCLETMSKMPDEFVDLVVTSPPYDHLRTYDEYSFDFEGVAKGLYRVTKQGGVVVWIVGDATIKGSETGTSFKQALFFKEIGFNLHDTMIWDKNSFTAVGALKTRYAQVFEYMFIFSKGKINTFNPLIDRKNKTTGCKSGNIRQRDGSMKRMSNEGKKFREYGHRFNIWRQSPMEGNKTGHPAPFPEKLINDHIASWSNENDLVYDPFMGSGTTAKVAMLNKRDYIGSEVSRNYCEIAEKRIGEYSLLPLLWQQ